MADPANRYDMNRWAANEVARMPRRKHWHWALGLSMAMTLTIPAIALFSPIDQGFRFSPVFISSLLPLMVTLQQSPFAREMWFGRDLAQLDEFERDALLMATRRAYRILMLLILALCVWLWAASALDWPSPATIEQWAGIAISMTAIGIALPILLAETMVPLPPAGDEEEIA